MQPEEGVDLEQYVKPVKAEKKKRPDWLKKGAKAAMPLLFTAGALMTGQGTARAEGPNELQTPTPTVQPEKSPTPTKAEKDAAIEAAFQREKAEIKAKSEAILKEREKERQEKENQDRLTPVGAVPAPVVIATPLSVTNGPEQPPARPPRQGGTPLHEVILNTASFLILPTILMGFIYAGYKIGRRLLAEGWNRTVGKLLFKISSPPFVPEKDRLDLENAELLGKKLKAEADLLEARAANLNARRSSGSGTPPPVTPTP